MLAFERAHVWQTVGTVLLPHPHPFLVNGSYDARGKSKQKRWMEVTRKQNKNSGASGVELRCDAEAKSQKGRTLLAEKWSKTASDPLLTRVASNAPPGLAQQLPNVQHHNSNR
ncbi:hypothetical protein TRVL_05480 [Trypanosoma vivax]|nr:hypothetical protein TRVL_05480 [Trypanosoma vivax]